MLRIRTQLWKSAALAVLIAASGCADVTSLLSPEFLSAVGGGTDVANLPGDAPAVLVSVENRTSRVAEMVVSYRDADDNVQQFLKLVTAGDSSGQALLCKVSELTLGDIADPSAPGVVIRLGNGTQDDPFIEVEPFGTILRDGVNFDCGDAVTFVVQPSGGTVSGYQTIAFIQRAQ